MKVFIMRHGTTVWNEKGISQGRSNNRLSKNGKLLTFQVAEKYKNQPIDAIFVSPIFRTVQTANIINKFHKAKIIKNDLLIEIDQGIFTGKAWKNLTDEEKRLKNIQDKSCGMESNESVYKRANEFIEFLKTQHYENVFVITHNVVASLISNILSGIETDFNNRNHLHYFKNAEVKVFEI